MNAHREIRIAKAQIANVLHMLDHALGDETLRADMIEGETSLNEVVSDLLAENEDDEGVIAALDAQVDIRSERIARFRQRIAARKKAIASLMDCAGLTSLPLPEATLSLRTLKPGPRVTEIDDLPEQFVDEKIVRKPNLDAIKEAVERGETIPGVIMTNGGSSLAVRRK